MTKTSNIFIGIDVSKNTLDISIANKHIKIKNTDEDISAFIKAEISSPGDTLAVLESTGGYEKVVIKMLNKAGVRVHRAHPNKVYSFAKVCNHFAKTDKLDAILLEKYAEFIAKDQTLPIITLDETQMELQSLRSVEQDLQATLHAHQCRADHLEGKALHHMQKQIDSIKKQLTELSSDIEQVINENEQLQNKQQLLTSYKGVGKKTANTLIVELPELGKLNHKEIASLVGLAPKTNESGKKIAKGHISGGRFYVRKSLYMAALVAARYNDKMKILYDRLIQSGKPAKVALVALMRKIIVCLNAMVKNNQIYTN